MVAQNNRFPLIQANDFASVKVKAEWFIKGVMPKADIGMIFGESGSGKSFLALDMAMAIAEGKPWRNLKVTQGSIAYVAAEGASGFRKRLNAYAHKHNVDLGFVPLYVIDRCPDFLGNSIDDELIIENVNSHGGIKIIIIDTLARVSAGANENSSDDMGRIISRCGYIAHMTGAMVVLIHHSGKDATKGARGWSGLKAAMDFEIEVTRKDELRTARLTKQKDGEDGQAFAFNLKVVEIGYDDDDDLITSCVVESEDMPVVVRKPQGEIRVAIYNEVKRLGVICDLPVEAEKLIQTMTQSLPKTEGEDRRRDKVKQAIKGLIDSRFLCKKDDHIDLYVEPHSPHLSTSMGINVG